jgi:putative ABC transport system permease protein
MRAIGRDLRDGVRALRSRPAFAGAVVVILALGIGANVAVFTLADAALWKPLPYPDAGRLVTLPARHRAGDRGAEVAFANFLDWKRGTRSFTSLGAWGPASFNAAAGEEGAGLAGAERVTGAAVSSGGLEALGVVPIAGRLFTEADERPGVHVALLSYGLWRSRFPGTAAGEVVGRTIRLGGDAYTILGVMPVEMRFPAQDVRIWVPLTVTERRAANRQSRWLYVFGRLRPGVTAAAAQADLDSATRALEAKYPRTNEGWGARVVGLAEHVAGRSRRVLWILLATVGLVLAVACANVANLQLARASRREREMAVRAAIGASAWDLARQLLVEGALLAAAGGAAGVLLARAAIPLLARVAASSLPRIEEAHVDGRVLLFAVAVSAVVAVVFGLAPLRSALRADLAGSLQGSRGTSGTREGTRLRRALTSIEVAAALVLTVGATLLVASLGRLLAVPSGLDPRGVFTVQTVLSSSRYPDEARRSAYFRALVERVSRVPGVESAAGISTLPLTGENATEGYAVDGQAPPPAGAPPEAGYRVVTPGYFRTARIPLLAGRDFSAEDRSGAPGVVVVNRTFAERAWPGMNPIGRRIRMEEARGEPHEVVGVVGDVRHSSLDAPLVPEIYVSFDQHPADAIVVLARSRLSPAVLGPRIAGEAASVDPAQPLFHAASMEDVLGASVSRPRLYAGVLGSFAGVALLLAVLGVASLVSFSVTSRLRELAIRAAMGAAPGELRGLVLRDAMGLAGAGIAVGLPASFAAARALRGLLFETAPGDPRVFAAAAALLALATIGASLAPAIRASRVDPIAALRD